MSKTTADFMIERLHEWGVNRIYGYPGDGINAIMGALADAEGTDYEMEFVQCRHEELSAFMATAHSKFTGQVGVCLATSGPGAIHVLNGLYDGKMDHQSVVAIVGQQDSRAIGGDYQQEVDLISLFKDVSPHYVPHVLAPGPDAAPGGSGHAHRQLRTRRLHHHRAGQCRTDGRHRRRPALCIRLHRAPRHPPELEPDAGLRRPSDGGAKDMIASVTGRIPGVGSD